MRQVLAAIQGQLRHRRRRSWPRSFWRQNGEAVVCEYAELLAPVEIQFEPHLDFKKRVPRAVGLIRTADTTQYGNIILESA